MNFPFELQNTGLESDDFNHLASVFSSTLHELIPFADGPTTFIPLCGSRLPKGVAREWRQPVIQVQASREATVSKELGTLFLPVFNENDLVAIAVVAGLEKSLAGQLSMEWLADRCRVLSREFLFCKQLSLDSITRLLNGRHFQNELAALIVKEHPDFSLLLIEVSCRSRNVEKVLSTIVRAGHFLNSCLGGFLVHHLGNGIFGLLLLGFSEQQAQVLAKKLLNWLKRENFQDSRLGFISVSCDDAVESAALILDHAWHALRAARRRGPHALCSYNSISNPEAHPLCKPNRSTLAQLGKQWKGTEKFSLVLLKQDNDPKGENAVKRACALVGAGVQVVVCSDREAFVYLDGMNEKKAVQWCRSFKKKLRPLGRTFSMGIAFFPCLDFKKSEIPLNARKALEHTEFFGPDTETVFDAVSLNVSGDIYYGEGDLVRAVKEYHKGLLLDPANANLLNSLGEAHAQMNRHKKALFYFKEALALDKDSFMALFNLGATFLHIKDEFSALHYFEKAWAVNADNPDLLMQLGRLYLQTKRCEDSVAMLTRYIDRQEEIKNDAGIGGRGAGHGQVSRYLGEAYKELGRHSEAIIQFERALHSNPRDAGALSMLGELYALEKQGDEIARSLCRQAVELDDSHHEYWYRLASIECGLGDYTAAQDSVRKSLVLNRNYGPALRLYGQIYAGLGQKGRARMMYEKAATVGQ